MSPRRRTALLVGALYLLTHVTSVAAVIAYRAGDAVELGVALEVVLALACVGTGVVLLPVLRPFSLAGAAAFAALRTLEAAVILAGALPMLALARLGENAPAAEPVLLNLHEASFLLGQGLVIAVNTLVLCRMLWLSGVVPRGIPVLGAAGGALVLLSDAGQLFGVVAESGPIAAALAAPVFAFELWFAGYLLLVGFRSGAPVPAPATR